MEIVSSISERLKELMGDMPLTEFARILGNTSKQSISAYINGTRTPKIPFMISVSQHYKVQLAWLLGYDVPKYFVTNYDIALESKLSKFASALNDAGIEELIDFAEYLCSKEEYRLADNEKRIFHPFPDEKSGEVYYIRHYLVPAAAGYASPVEGEDYELIPVSHAISTRADFCISISGDSMEPYIADGEVVYVKRDATLEPFDVGIFYIDGDVLCKQYCTDSYGTLYLLSANTKREDANRTINSSSTSTVICFGKVILPKKLPRPIY